MSNFLVLRLRVPRHAWATQDVTSGAVQVSLTGTLRCSRTFACPRVSETFNVQFRFEAFNALNHTNFNPPTSTSLQLFTQALAPIPSAGNLTSTSTTSRQLQFAIKVLW